LNENHTKATLRGRRKRDVKHTIKGITDKDLYPLKEPIMGSNDDYENENDEDEYDDEDDDDDDDDDDDEDDDEDD
jgi:hypothetical protein